MSQDRSGKDFRDLGRLLGISPGSGRPPASRAPEPLREPAARATGPQPSKGLDRPAKRPVRQPPPPVRRFVPPGQDLFGTPVGQARAAPGTGTETRNRRTRASIEAMGLGAVRTLGALPPAGPSRQDRDELAARLRDGTPPDPAPPGARALDVVIGLDVGSTSTKVVVRTPYDALLREGQAVPVPDWLRAEGHPHYWTTVLWREPGGRHALLPGPGAAAMERLKVAFLEAARDGGDGAERAACDMTAWIALMLRQTRGWLRRSQPRLAAERRLRLAVNVGIPARSHDATALRDRYALCCHAAWRLAWSGAEITAASASAALTEATLPGRDDPTDVGVVPELAGAIAGFARSAEARDGAYVLLDVGGLTVDAAFFRLTGVRKADAGIRIYGAELDHLGVDVTRAWVAQAPGEDREAAIAPLVGSLLCQPIIRGHEKFVAAPGPKPEATTPIFVIGGGRHSAPHRASLPWAVDSLKPSTFATRLREEDLAPQLRRLATASAPADCDRLLVACGLSLPLGDIPFWTLPSEIADAGRRGPRDIGASFVSKDQV